MIPDHEQEIEPEIKVPCPKCKKQIPDWYVCHVCGWKEAKA